MATSTGMTILTGSATIYWTEGQPVLEPWTSTVRILHFADQTQTQPLGPGETYTPINSPASSAAPSGSDIASSSATTSPSATASTGPSTTAIPSTSADFNTSTTTSNPNQSSTSVSAPSSSHGSSGHSTGALAGAAVGCAIAGILIGVVAAWLLFRRRRKGADDRATVLLHDPRAFEKPSPAVSDDSTPLNHVLLDATPDREIEAELRALGHLIDQHVEKYYHLDPVTDVSILSDHLAPLGVFPHGTEAIAGVCAKPISRQTGLRHVISQVIFNSLDIYSNSAFSMLPAPLSTFLNSIPSQNVTAQSAAISEWRRLSAFLLHPSPYDRTPLPVSEVTLSSQAPALATRLNAFLHHFVGTSHGAQTDHLQAVIVECTKLGYVILSQPQDWRFVFEKGNSVVVCPGLDKGGRRAVEPEVGVLAA